MEKTKPIKLTRNEFEAIGPKIGSHMGTAAMRLIMQHLPAIDKAYVNNDCELSINLTFKLKPAAAGAGVFIDSKINFVKERCKQSEQTVINEKQIGLPGSE